MLFSEANKAFATSDSDTDANDNKINVAGTIHADDTPPSAEAALDNNLTGNFLDDVGMPKTKYNT